MPPPVPVIWIAPSTVVIAVPRPNINTPLVSRPVRVVRPPLPVIVIAPASDRICAPSNISSPCVPANPPTFGEVSEPIPLMVIGAVPVVSTTVPAPCKTTPPAFCSTVPVAGIPVILIEPPAPSARTLMPSEEPLLLRVTPLWIAPPAAGVPGLPVIMIVPPLSARILAWSSRNTPKAADELVPPTPTMSIVPAPPTSTMASPWITTPVVPDVAGETNVPAPVPTIRMVPVSLEIRPSETTRTPEAKTTSPERADASPRMKTFPVVVLILVKSPTTTPSPVKPATEFVVAPLIVMLPAPVEIVELNIDTPLLRLPNVASAAERAKSVSGFAPPPMTRLPPLVIIDAPLRLTAPPPLES